MNQKIESTSLRVLFINGRFHSIYGAQANVIRLARVYGNSIMLTTAEGVFKEECRRQGLQCEVVNASPDLNSFGKSILSFNWFRKLMLIPKIIALNLRIRKVIVRERVDVVFSVDIVSFVFVFLACLLTRKRSLVYIQGDWNPRLLKVVCGLFASRILLIADAIRPQFSRWIYGRMKTRTLYSGFPIPLLCGASRLRDQFRKENAIPNSATVIGLVGSITSRKGGDVLAKAIPTITRRFPNTTFVYFGDVPPGHNEFASRLKSIILENASEANVVFAGFRDQETIYQSIDVLALPSNSEGLPSVIIEALSYGIPVVASDVAGAKEILRSRELGLLVRHDSPEELGAAIVDLLQSDLNSSRQLRHEFARTHFSTNIFKNAFENILNELR